MCVCLQVSEGGLRRQAVHSVYPSDTIGKIHIERYTLGSRTCGHISPLQ